MRRQSLFYCPFYSLHGTTSTFCRNSCSYSYCFGTSMSKAGSVSRKYALLERLILILHLGLDTAPCPFSIVYYCSVFPHRKEAKEQGLVLINAFLNAEESRSLELLLGKWFDLPPELHKKSFDSFCTCTFWCGLLVNLAFTLLSKLCSESECTIFALFSFSRDENSGVGLIKLEKDIKLVGLTCFFNPAPIFFKPELRYSIWAT